MLTRGSILICATSPSLFVSLSIYSLPRLVPPATRAVASSRASREGDTSGDGESRGGERRLLVPPATGNLLALGLKAARTRITTSPDDPGRVPSSFSTQTLVRVLGRVATTNNQQQAGISRSVQPHVVADDEKVDLFVCWTMLCYACHPQMNRYIYDFFFGLITG